MGEIGLLVSLPTESLAVRLAIASFVAVLLAASLMRAGVRMPAVRARLALVPAASMVVVTALFLRAPELPSLWHTVGADPGLAVPVRDTYLSFQPMALPLLLGLWTTIALLRIGVRLLRHRHAVAELEARRAGGAPAPDRVMAATRTLAASLRISTPDVVIVPSLPGGAAIVGLREPVLLIDGDLAIDLDDQELTAVVAHELAHVQRRDNLVAFGLSLLRDVFFFVPGSRWSTSMLLREREHAADTVAVELTDRPGALASVLLKVIDSRASGAPTACSPLLSEGTLVARVQALCDDRPPPSRARRVAEVSGAVAVACGAVLTAALAPSLVVGQDHARERLGLLLSDVGAPGDVDERSVVFRAFDSATEASTTTTTALDPPDLLDAAPVLEAGDHDLAGPAGLEACARSMAACRDRLGRPQVSMPPRPLEAIDDELVQWRLEPIVRSDSQENALFWWSRQGAS